MAPRRSGRPMPKSRVWKPAMKQPSSTATTPEAATGGRSAAGIGCLPDLNGGDHGHAGPQLPERWLPGLERDADRNALHHLGEVAVGIVGGQQGELRAAGG